MSKSYQPKKPMKRNNENADVFCFIVIFTNLILYAEYFSTASSFSMGILYLSVTLIPFLFISMALALREIFLWKRCYDSLSKLAIRSVSLRPSFVTALVINIFYTAYCLQRTKLQPEVITLGFSIFDVMVSFQIVLLGQLFKWQDSPLTESYRLEEPLSLSGGSSMAFGFYYGYLKLILKDLPKRIQDFIDKENIDDRKMPVKKLFILIPSSSQVLNNPHQPNIRAIDIDDGIECHKEDRGMVKRRVYKHTLYELLDKEKPKYILVVEYASPLKTFFEFIDSLNGSHYKDYIREVVSSFYYTLETIINEDKEVKYKVELIYYNDDKAADLSTIIKRRIKHLMNQN